MIFLLLLTLLKGSEINIIEGPLSFVRPSLVPHNYVGVLSNLDEIRDYWNST